MQIKNIRQFRTLWRDEQGYQMSNWDEHFIGSNHGERSGFYKMVNGIVENIKADLTPKLQNAQDEQAIYEFLQNAADSRSTECAVIYDEQYFMVLNNGAPFTDKDLKALLNSFQGTKADKSKAENCDKIGRYGIGFKLAYRLMGKLDGAEELVRDLAGPLLFSWHNPEQFQALTRGGELQASEQAQAPWLLKILLACFPCAPGETVRDLDYQERVLFPQEELSELRVFLEKHAERLRSLSLEQGSLFFLRFGPKKHEKLRESLLNIQSGIAYSMNTLKTLQRVVLQDTVVERAPVELERFSILPGTEDFKRIDPEFPACPIDLVLGLPTQTERALELKNAPSLYQFFPMRNERHGLAFFVHCTAFAKITDRTRLDDQGEANIETLSYLSSALKRQLNKYKTEDFDRYALIYKALLMSDRSKEYDAALINKHLYDPLLQYIQNNIPTRKRNTFPKDLVVLKDTRLPVEPMHFGIGKEWFLWTEEPELLRDAANNAKLGLRRWTLRDLLLEANPGLVNTWLEEAEDEDYQTFISELREVELDAAFLQKLREIRCFKFADNQGNKRFYALDDLRQADNLFLMNERTAVIRAEIKALGFAVLEFDMQDYSGLLKQLESHLDYLVNDRALFAKLAGRTGSAKLAPEQKHRLFGFVRSLKDIPQTELRRMVLFSNRLGQACPLQGLLTATVQVPEWLDDYRIAETEDGAELQELLVEAQLWEAYTHVLLPHWDELCRRIDGKEIKAFYQETLRLFGLRPLLPKLNAAACCYTDARLGFLPSGQVFYHKALAQVQDYEALRSAVFKTLELPLPEREILDFLAADPFKCTETTAEKDWKNRQTEWLRRCQSQALSPAEKRALFDLLRRLLQPKDWQNLPLFCDRTGERRPLSRLLPAQAAVEAWLQSYRIQADEEGEVLQGLLVQESDIYTQLFLNDWNNLVALPGIRKDLPAFYESVLKYAALSKTPKPLGALRYVFVSDEVGFVSPAETLYHSAFLQVSDYKNLRTAVHALTKLHCPHPSVLPFLQQSIFKLKETAPGKAAAVEQTLLNREEVAALMQAMELSGEDFFALLCVEEQGKDYSVLRRTGRIAQVYLDKSQQKVADKIRALYADRYKILPLKLYVPEYRNKGLMTAGQLFEQLSKSKDAPADLLSAMLSESGGGELQQQVFDKIDKIVLRQGVLYGKESFEHQALQLFRNKDADYDRVRSKIWIETAEGRSHRLSDLAFEPGLTFSIDRFGKFPLELAAVLPRFAELQALCEQIFHQIQDFEAPTLLKRRCFEYQERPLKDVFTELKRDYLRLDNAAQLAFVLLYAKEAGSDKLVRDFSIKSADGEWLPLGRFEVYYWNAPDFVQPQALLDREQYAGLPDLLKLSDKRPALEFGGQRFALEPHFDRQRFFGAPVRSPQEGEPAEQLLLSVLDYAYAKWSETEPSARPVRVDFSGQNDGRFLGLDLRGRVFPHSYALPHEYLPEWLLTWIGKERQEEGVWQNLSSAAAETAPSEGETLTEVAAPPLRVWIPSGKLGFLHALGLNTDRSELVQLRSYLLKGQAEAPTQKQLNDLARQERRLLEGTVLWLHEQNARLHSGDERLHWLRKLYNALEQLPADLPLPHIVQTKDQDSVFVYALDNCETCDLYGFDANRQSLWREKHGISIAQLLDAVHISGNRLTNLDIKGRDILPVRIDEELNLQHLQSESKEWAAEHYQKWKENQPYRVYLYPHAMPYRLRFLDATIKNYEQGNAVLCDTVAYVNRQADNVEEELFKIAKNATLSEQMLLQLLRFKNEKSREAGHKVVERVVVEDALAPDEELIESPGLDTLKAFKAGRKGRLKAVFDLDSLPESLLEQLVDYAQKTKVIVKRGV